MSSRFARATTVIVAFVLVGCASAASPSPRATQPATALPSVEVVESPTPRPSVAPSRAASAPSIAPSPPPPTSESLPVRASAREISSYPVLIAPGSSGEVYVLIPSRTDSTQLVLLDSAGRPRDGWPVHLAGVDHCDQLLAADDGSVRVLCTQPNPDGNMFALPVIFGFGQGGRALEGWPIDDISASFVTGRMAGDVLTVVTVLPLTDLVTEGQPSAEARVLTIGRNGAISTGVGVPVFENCCGSTWTMGLDSIGYRVGWPDRDAATTRISAVGTRGAIDGWPVNIGGTGIDPAFDRSGRLVTAIGSAANGMTRVVIVDTGGNKRPGRSFPLRTVVEEGDMGCVVTRPRPPLVASDGTTFVYSELDSSVFAVDAALNVKDGWPYEPATTLEVARPGLEEEHEAGYCPTPVAPAVGPDGTLYLALKARNEGVGGSLTAVSPNSSVRSGWPVTLSRAGSEFWSVTVGPDGTAYALAIEPESGGTSSGSILAIAPDSTVRWTTTIIEP